MTIQAQASVTTLSLDVRASVSTQCEPASNPTHASTVKEGGQVKFENDNYRITANDNNEVNILDKHTGETTRVWGDPHVDVNGKHAFDFWGTTTFNLKDGTKVTIETTPWVNDPKMTLASKVTITNGDYGVQIKGVDSNKVGDLSFEEGKGWGKMIDGAVDDGNKLYAKQNGGGFVGIDDKGQVRNVDQKFINETDLKKGGAWKEQLQDLFSKLSSLISIVSHGAFGTGNNADAGPSPARHHARPHFPHHHHHFSDHFATTQPAIRPQAFAQVDLTAKLSLTQFSFSLNR